MAKAKKTPIEEALERGDQATVDAILAEAQKEKDERVAAYLAKHKPREVPWLLAGVTEADMKDGTQYASGLHLRKWRSAIELGQVVLSEAMGVSQGRISQIEKDDYIPQGMRWKLWNFIFKEMDAKAEREAKSRPPAPPGDPFRFGEFLENIGGFKSETDRLKEQLALSREELELVKKDRDSFKALVSLDLLDRCILLEKELIKALEANAEYVKLFALKGAAVAGDELQQEIEAKLKKEK